MNKKPKKVLVISTFPPKHCGIATYAQEHMLYLKRKGDVVYTFAFDGESAANFRFNNGSIKGLCKAIIFLLFVRFDEVHMHFTNGLIWPRSHMQGRKRQLLALVQYLWLFTLAFTYRRRFHFFGHEITADKGAPKRANFIHGTLYSFLKNIYVHTEEERKKYLDCFGHIVNPKYIRVMEHNSFMTPKFQGSKSQARQRLGLDEQSTIFICIGFIQHHKGFDQVVDAMNFVEDGKRHLFIVGSIRVEAPEYRQYLEFLEDKLNKTKNASLHYDFLSDEKFDAWIKAADYVVLPYREIWSSGVGARAKLLGTPVIMRDHPNLLSQFKDDPNVLKFATQEELTHLLATAPKSYTPHRMKPLLTAYENPYLLTYDVLKRKKFLFVMPTFGRNVRGGAESFVFKFAEALAKRGANLEVWTTTSEHVVGRNDVLRAKDDAGLPFKVRRFRANAGSEWLFDRVHRFMNMEGRCGALLRKIWIRTNLTGSGMREALLAEGHKYDVIQLFHYLLGSAHQLSGLFPDRTILHPFIHNEAPARNPVMRDLFAGVRGVTCNSYDEWEIARTAQCGLLPSLFRPIGNGVEPIRARAADGFAPLEKFRDSGYLVFVGRMIPEKNLGELIAWHRELLKKDPDGPGLVFIGDGYMKDDPIFSDNPKFAYLGWISDGDKKSVLKHALALVQPSLLESFSLVIMEAWLEGVPVIVHKNCGATVEHVTRSGGGGFAIATSEEYITTVEGLRSDRQKATDMGQVGKRYVENNFSWSEVCKNYVQAVADLLEWRGDYVPLEDMEGRVSERFDLPYIERQQGIIGKSFYVDYEKQFRDGDVAPESWNYYVEKHLHKFQSDAKIVDIGAGRGKFLSHLKKALPQNYYFGVEPDERSFAELLDSGFAGARMLADEFCDTVEPGSIDVVTMLHVVEHIPWDDLMLTLAKVRKALKQGGLLIVELPNAWSALVNSVFFWGDPTHIRPLAPPSLNTALENMGFKVWDKPEFAPFLNPEQKAALEEKIGSPDFVKTFYGYQDFAFICQKV